MNRNRIWCPHCKAVLKLKCLRPGQFRPKCPGSDNIITLIVPADDSSPVRVQLTAPPADLTAPDEPQPEKLDAK